MQYLREENELEHLDLPISSWEDSILAPKNQNILAQPPSLKPFSRRQTLSQKRKNHRVSAKENRENIPISLFLDRTLTRSIEDRDASNLRKLKFKM